MERQQPRFANIKQDKVKHKKITWRQTVNTRKHMQTIRVGQRERVFHGMVPYLDISH